MPLEVSREKWHGDQPLNRVVTEPVLEEPEPGQDA
jgi:hypothetical protein